MPAKIIYSPREIINKSGEYTSYYCFPNGHGAILTRHVSGQSKDIRILQPTKLSGLSVRHMTVCGPEAFPLSAEAVASLLNTIASWPDTDTKDCYSPPPARRKGTWQRNDKRGDPWPWQESMNGASANYAARITRGPK